MIILQQQFFHFYLLHNGLDENFHVAALLRIRDIDTLHLLSHIGRQIGLQ